MLNWEFSRYSRVALIRGFIEWSYLVYVLYRSVSFECDQFWMRPVLNAKIFASFQWEPVFSRIQFLVGEPVFSGCESLVGASFQWVPVFSDCQTSVLRRRAALKTGYLRFGEEHQKSQHFKKIRRSQISYRFWIETWSVKTRSRCS